MLIIIRLRDWGSGTREDPSDFLLFILLKEKKG